MSTPSIVPPSSDTEARTAYADGKAHRRMRAANDLYGRSLVGPIFYALASAITAAVAGFLSPPRLFGVAPPLAYLVMFFLRRTNRPPTAFADPKPYEAWRARHWALIHVGCLLWGAVSFYFGYVARDSWMTITISVIMSVTLGTALSTAFSMDPKQTFLTLLALYVPSITAFTLEPKLRPIALTLSIYLLYLFSNLRRVTKEYAAQIDTELALLRSRAEIEQMSRSDALTGLPNRREYETAYPKAWHQASRSQGDIALIVFDLDHFKALNDGHGHLAGDACLRHFALLLAECFRREVDLVARLGGEEFVAVLPGVTASSAERMAEALRAKLEERPCEFQGKTLPMTVSAGVGSATWSTDTKPEATFGRVDAACYEAKKAGRNRVVLASTTASVPKIAVTSAR